MRKYELREKELIIAYHAMSLLMLAIEQVKDHWTENDIEIAAKLTQRLRERRNQIVRGETTTDAENTD